MASAHDVARSAHQPRAMPTPVMVRETSPAPPAAAPPVIAFHAHDDECERRFEPHFAVARFSPVQK